MFALDLKVSLARFDDTTGDVISVLDSDYSPPGFGEVKVLEATYSPISQ